jgi:hypothetical protein
MIISASRRTDIPAFYAEWFMNRIRAGFCTVPNPFNQRQVAQVSLRPEDVDVIVFWTRNPRPLLPHLAELDERGYRYYFQYTLMDNPPPIEAHSPPAQAALQAFAELAQRVGPPRVIWRYDPIVFTSLSPPEFHAETYARLAQALRGCTARSVISLFDPYPKARQRLEAMAQQGAALLPFDPAEPWFGPFIAGLAQAAGENGMEIVSCAEQLDQRPYGVRPGKCVDDEYIRRVFGLDVTHKKDPGQRKACGCVTSKDIGAYDTCLFGCAYCYATTSFARAKRRRQAHDPHAPSLIPHAAPEGQPGPE